MDVRQNPLNPCELEKTFDNVTWIPFADLSLCAPALTFGYAPSGRLTVDEGFGAFEVADGPWVNDPPPTWFASATGTAAMTANTNDQCTAAANAANVIYQTFKDIQQNLINNVVAQALKWELSPSGVEAILGYAASPFVALAIGTFFAGYQALFLATDFSQADFRKLICLLRNNASGVTGNWTISLSGVTAGMAASGISSDSQNVILQILNLIGQNGLNLAGKTNAVASYSCASGQFINYEGLTLVQNWSGNNAGSTGRFNNNGLGLTQTFGLLRERLMLPTGQTSGFLDPNGGVAAQPYFGISAPVSGTHNNSLGDTRREIWVFNNLQFTQAQATAAVRAILQNPTYSGLVIGAGFTTLQPLAGAYVQTGWNPVLYSGGVTQSVRYDWYGVQNYGAC